MRKLMLILVAMVTMGLLSAQFETKGVYAASKAAPPKKTAQNQQKDTRPEAWGETRWGMTIPEVQKILKCDLYPVNEKRGDVTFTHKGCDQDIAGHTFQIFFSFSGGFLERVLLSCDGDDYFNAFSDVVSALKKKYGTARDESPRLMRGARAESLVWLTPTSEIRASYYLLDLQVRVAKGSNISYSPRITGYENKL